MVTGWRPVAQPPNLDGQSTIFITPGAGWPSCTPRHRALILVAFYDLYGLQWDYSFPQPPHGESPKLCVTFILPWHRNFDQKIFGTVDPEFLLLPLLGNQPEVIYICIIHNAQINYSNLVELNMKLVYVVQYNTIQKFYRTTQSCCSPTATYMLQYEFYKLLCIKFCICTVHSMKSTIF